MAKRRRRKKSGNYRIIKLCVGLGVIGLVFYASLSLLIEPIKTQMRLAENSQADFIGQIAPHAQLIQKRDGLLASISIGQAILESDWGASDLSQQHNNLFGIKSFGDEPRVTMYTKEYIDGQWLETPAAFRSYPSWEASLDDHVNLFKVGVNWNPDLYKKVLNAKDYREAAFELQEAGYATDPNYDQKIIGVIEAYHLNQYDELP